MLTISIGKVSGSRSPVYSIRSINVISDYSSVFRNLTVAYRGEKVENSTVSKVLIFNRGATALDGNDIAALNPLRILARRCNILDATVLTVNNPSSGFAASFDKVNELITIGFERLKHKDGAVVAVIHTGPSSQNVDVVGDMKEVKGLRRIQPHLMKIARPVNFRSVIWTAALVLIAFISAFGILATFLNFEGLLWGLRFMSGLLVLWS